MPRAIHHGRHTYSDILMPNRRWSKSDSPSTASKCTETILKKRAGLQKHLWQGFSLICYGANWNAIQVRDLTSAVLIFRELVFTSAIFLADSSHPISPRTPPLGFCLDKKCFFLCSKLWQVFKDTPSIYIQEWFPAPKQSIYYKTRFSFYTGGKIHIPVLFFFFGKYQNTHLWTKLGRTD